MYWLPVMFITITRECSLYSLSRLPCVLKYQWVRQNVWNLERRLLCCCGTGCKNKKFLLCIPVVHVRHQNDSVKVAPISFSTNRLPDWTVWSMSVRLVSPPVLTLTPRCPEFSFPYTPLRYGASKLNLVKTRVFPEYPVNNYKIL